MGISLDSLEDLMESSINNKIDTLISKVISSDNTLLENIDNLDKELDKYSPQRYEINGLKIEKDTLIKQYIYETKFPNKLNKDYLNYKALLFYFLEQYTYENMILHKINYKNNISKLYLNKKNTFSNFFPIDIPIKINVQLSNFPHLIGYKDKYYDTVNNIWINQKSRKKEFIRNILYESNLTNDYEKDGCHLDKIEAFSWIIDTLNNPIFIFDKDGLKPKSNLKADIIFLRKKDGLYHYVSLKKHINSIDNEYYINSHHYLDEKDFQYKFNKNKRIFDKL